MGVGGIFGFFFVGFFFSFLGIRKRNPDPEKGKNGQTLDTAAPF
jgi:hypothetical protein